MFFGGSIAKIEISYLDLDCYPEREQRQIPLSNMGEEMSNSPLNWKSGFRKLEQQNEPLARMMRNQAIMRNQAPLFPPALEEHTVAQGQIVADTMLRAMTDPDVALAYWLEVNSAWLRLWRSAIESIATGVPPRYEYDIFLSHAKLDADQKQLDPVIKALEDGKFKFKVFVDWRDAPELDRRNVTKETARALREKMKRSRVLVYILSEKEPFHIGCPGSSVSSTDIRASSLYCR